MIKEFRGEYRWLSNFWPCEVRFGGITYPSVEHFYVAMKTTDLYTRLQISKLETAGAAKRYGRKMKVRPDWDEIKISIMQYGLEQKFSQEPLRSKLLETEDTFIQEGNTWGDIFWGIDLESGEGRNILGKMLMKLRSEIQVKN